MPITADLPATDTDILITRVLNAPRELVFRTFTEPAHLARWWLPPGFTNTACEIDLRVGGRFHLTMRSPDGRDYPCDGEYLEITPPERLVYLGTGADDHPCGAGLPPRGRVTVIFADQAGKTRLTIRASFNSESLREAARAAGFESSWNGTLDAFAGYLEGLGNY
ncbi:SRPBCC domain-containing protein [Chitinilyticum litopenaei]|uniref:SRPBCC domain-containing protein n=1 Tax=Chitinilyticum litopenaei TaxID=1121276 RepID=UPI00041C8DFB|nr:SRPBCC domain-containing protein [Chitinilyticum litopenaei]